MKKIERVTIIGANGTVGSGVAGIFASFGDAIVYLVARSKEKAEAAKEKIALSVHALSIEKRLIAKTYDEIKECIENSDLIFESVAEDLNIKKEIHSLISKYVKPDCIIATGTSGLSIEELSNCYDDSIKGRFLGIHFFNPPYNLTLCELIPTKYTDSNFLKEIKEYLNDKLLRDVIVVKDSPAFLANRIGFKFMNEALNYALLYKDNGGIDYIDAILGCYTGRNMPPLETINFVGLDIHKAIVDNLYNNIKDKDFLLPEYVNDLIEDGKLGIKTGMGLYKKSDDEILVYDIKSNLYRKKEKYFFEFKEKAILEFKNAHYKEGFNYIKNDNSLESKICMTFLLKYIIYAIELSNLISENIADCDIAMATGFNWIPPFALIEVLGGKNELIKLCNKYLGNGNYEKVLNNIVKSNFDYRKYIKAKE